MLCLHRGGVELSKMAQRESWAELGGIPRCGTLRLPPHLGACPFCPPVPAPAPAPAPAASAGAPRCPPSPTGPCPSSELRGRAMGLLWGLCAHRGWPTGIQPLERHRASTGSCRAPCTGGPCSVPCPAPRFSCPLSLPKLAPGSSKPHPGALPGCQPLLTLSWTWLQLGFLQPEGRKKRGSEEQPGRGAQPGDTEGSHVARGQLPRDARPGKAWPGHTCS